MPNDVYDNVRTPAWLAVRAEADTVRLLPVDGCGPDFFVKQADYNALKSENERLRMALSLARTVLVTACGTEAPYIRIALERIDRASQ